MATGANKKPAEVKLDNQDPEKIKTRLLAKYPPKVAYIFTENQHFVIRLHRGN